MIRALLLLSAVLAAGAGEVTVSSAFGHRDPVLAMLATADGGLLTFDGRVRLWDLADGRMRWMQSTARVGYHGTYDRPPRLRCSGGRVVVAEENEVCELDRRTGRELLRRRIEKLFAVSPDGRWLFRDAQMGILCEAIDGTHQARIATDARLNWVAVSPGSDLAYAGINAREAQGTERYDAVLTLVRQGDSWAANGPAIRLGSIIDAIVVSHPDGGDRLVAYTQLGEHDEGHELRWWRLPLLAGAKPERSVVDMPSILAWNVRLCSSTDGSVAISPAPKDGHGIIQVFRPSAAEPIPHDGDPEDSSSPDAIAFADGGRQLAVAMRGRPPRLSPVGHPEVPLAALSGNPGGDPVQSLARSVDGRLLYACCTSGLQTWDVALLRLAAWTPSPDAITLLPVAGASLAIIRHDDGSEQFLDLAGNRPVLAQLTAPAPGFALTADAGHAVLAQADGAAIYRLSDGVRTGTVAVESPGDAYAITRIVPSRDGTRVLVLRGGAHEYQLHDAMQSTPFRCNVRVCTLDGTALGGFSSECDAPTAIVAEADGWSMTTPLVHHFDKPDQPAALLRVGADGQLLGRDPPPEHPATAAAPVPAVALPAAGAGAWYARLDARIGALGEIVVQRDGGAPAVHLFAAAESWAAWDDSGRFDGSRSAARLLAASVDGHAIGSDEAAPWTCRPDQLLGDLGCDDAALLAAAAKPSLRHAGPAVTSERPTAAIVDARREGQREIITIDAASGAGLAAVDAWVNGVPLPSSPASGTAARVELPVGLAPGLNLLEVAARDATGQASWRTSLPLPPGAPATARLHAVCFGVSRYRNHDLDLRYAAKDAIDLALALQDCPLGDRPPLVRSWTDAQVRPEALAEAAGELAKAQPQDVVIIYLAGHGLYVRDPVPTYHYMCCDADPAHPAETAIAWPKLAAMLDGCPSRHRLIILDTCESGELEDDVAPAVGGLAVAGTRGMRSTVQRSAAGSPLAAQWLTRDRERIATADLARSTGAVVLASSRGGEPSFESEADANGLFTQSLIDALRGGADADHDGLITADELLRRVAAVVAERSGGQQRPTIDRDNPLAGIALPVLPPAE